MIQGNNRGKIKQPPAKEVIKYIINPSISDAEAERSFQNYVECNKAHVLMLEKQGIIKKEVAKKILEVAEEMTAMGSKPSFALPLCTRVTHRSCCSIWPHIIFIFQRIAF